MVPTKKIVLKQTDRGQKNIVKKVNKLQYVILYLVIIEMKKKCLQEPI